MTVLMGLLSIFFHATSPSTGMAECEQYVESLRHLTDRAHDRLIEMKRPYSTGGRDPVACAVVSFTLTEGGEPGNINVLAYSSGWIKRLALRVVSQSRYSIGEEEDVALIVHYQLSED